MPGSFVWHVCKVGCLHSRPADTVNTATRQAYLVHDLSFLQIARCLPLLLLCLLLSAKAL